MSRVSKARSKKIALIARLRKFTGQFKSGVFGALAHGADEPYSVAESEAADRSRAFAGLANLQARPKPPTADIEGFARADRQFQIGADWQYDTFERDPGRAAT